MKIVAIDNFNRETVDDVLIAENVEPSYGEELVYAWNKVYGKERRDFFMKILADDYKLKKFEP